MLNSILEQYPNKNNVKISINQYEINHIDYLNERAVQYLLRITSTSYISNKAIKFI